MGEPRDLEPLPEELEHVLRSLGQAAAPPRLWTRVQLGRLGAVEAPEALRERVWIGIVGKVEAPAALWERVEPEVQALARRAPVFTPRRLAAAAALLLLAGVGVVLGNEGVPPRDAPTAAARSRAELRDYYAARARQAIVLRAGAEDLSPTARRLAAQLGAPVTALVIGRGEGGPF